jgi:hypothetical protein
VGAHALGELPLGSEYLLYEGLRTIAGVEALLSLLLERPPGRQQVLAIALGRLELRVADPELLRATLGNVSVAAGVGVFRHTVGAHAVGVGDR